MTAPLADNPGLARAVAEYAELDAAVGERIDGRLDGVCASCPKPCCRPDVCRQILESWWLRTVSEHAHGHWWPDDWETRDACIAMGETGCTIRAGRPAICRSFVCDRYVEAYDGLWETVYVSALSDLPWEVAQLSSRVSLETLEPEDAPRYLDAVLARLAEGRRLLALADRLVDPGEDDVTRHRITLRLLAAMPRFLRATTRRGILAALDAADAKGPPRLS